MCNHLDHVDVVWNHDEQEWWVECFDCEHGERWPFTWVIHDPWCSAGIP